MGKGGTELTERIRINPVTRISGFMEIDAILENNKVVDAKTEGLMFRGFETMLLGRSPFDAVYFTERICGICSTAHGVVSTLALENALEIVPTEQGRYLRDIIHGCEFLQNHIRHFYQYTVPDYIKLPDKYPIYEISHNDFRLPKIQNDEIVKNYFDSLAISRSAHEMLAVLGGKAPHNHGVFIGGITTQATTDKIIKIQAILHNIYRFIIEKMIPDAYTIGEYYKEYYYMGEGYGNLLSYGCFNNYKELGTLYVDPLVYNNRTIRAFDHNKITEEIDYSWYKNSQIADVNKERAYSWIKAARYENEPYEVGPLARQWLSGEYTNGISTMDRTIARVLEAKKIVEILVTLIENLIPGVSVQEKYDIPEKAYGMGLLDTTRGALGHWVRIDNYVISFYQLITPSVWNLSPRTDVNKKGTGEMALIGTKVNDSNNPIELGRIIRSFDPCVSCATHVYINGELKQTIRVVL